MTTERSGMSLSDALEALFKEWFDEPDGIWAVNLSKRRCAEQLRKVLDDPNYSIQIHLATRHAAVPDAMPEDYCDTQEQVCYRNGWNAFRKAMLAQRDGG